MLRNIKQLHITLLYLIIVILSSLTIYQHLNSQEYGLTLQAECAKQADKLFHDGWKKDQASYLSHYDPSRNKCYVEFEVANSTVNIKAVLDGFEGNEVAKYMRYISLDQDGNPQKPITCEISTLKKSCSTSGEFNTLVRESFGINNTSPYQ